MWMNRSSFTALAVVLGAACGSVQDTPADARISDAPPACSETNAVLGFDGNQFVVVDDSTSIRQAGDLTIEAWVRFDAVSTAVGAYHAIVIKSVGVMSFDSFSLYYSEGNLRGQINLGIGGAAVVHPWAPVLERWYFLAFSYTRASMMQRLYIDGEQVASMPTDQTPMYDGHALTIGSDFGNDLPGGFFIGRIDEVRLWSAVRTRDELIADSKSCAPGPLSNLAAYWRFNERSGQFAQDASGNDNQGMLGPGSAAEPGDPTWIASMPPY